MISTGSKRPSNRCLILWAGLPLIPLLLIGSLGWSWFERLRTLDDQVAVATDQLHRYQRLLQSLPRLRAELEQVSANQEFRSFYIDAPTPALAGAELQTRLQDLVRNANGRLISTQVLPTPTQEGPPLVRVRAQLQGTTETLLDILLEVEQARPFLFVDQLSVRSMSRSVVPGQRARQIPGQQDGQLTVRLDVFGYVLGGSP
ncbi:type II secretion system protein GspM [Thioalkalicoccus limnaeus]|uniref:Type II secretion system protein GspM n=1 Tax=Thioalkalicoccus limnaeus TaxID=120681 RepID=A0ABV4BDV7_9GAMM